MADPILALKAVRKSYAVGLPTETEVLHGIDLELERGGFRQASEETLGENLFFAVFQKHKV